MCGIVGTTSYGHLENGPIDDLMKSLGAACMIRGRDATGIAYNTLDDGKVMLTIRKLDVTAIDTRFNWVTPKDVLSVMGHTRQTTRGPARDNKNNHPFFGQTKDGKWFTLCHNGHISNYEALRKEYNIVSEPEDPMTDSYVAVELIETQEELNFDSIRFMAERVEGNFVFAILDGYNNTWLVKGNNPISLIHFKHHEVWCYASTFDILMEGLVTSASGKVMLKDLFKGGESTEFMEPAEGEIIKICANGIISKDTFTPKKFVPKPPVVTHYPNYDRCGYREYSDGSYQWFNENTKRWETYDQYSQSMVSEGSSDDLPAEETTTADGKWLTWKYGCTRKWKHIPAGDTFVSVDQPSEYEWDRVNNRFKQSSKGKKWKKDGMFVKKLDSPDEQTEDEYTKFPKNHKIMNGKLVVDHVKHSILDCFLPVCYDVPVAGDDEMSMLCTNCYCVFEVWKEAKLTDVKCTTCGGKKHLAPLHADNAIYMKRKSAKTALEELRMFSSEEIEASLKLDFEGVTVDGPFRDDKSSPRVHSYSEIHTHNGYYRNPTFHEGDSTISSGDGEDKSNSRAPAQKITYYNPEDETKKLRKKKMVVEVVDNGKPDDMEALEKLFKDGKCGMYARCINSASGCECCRRHPPNWKDEDLDDFFIAREEKDVDVCAFSSHCANHGYDCRICKHSPNNEAHEDEFSDYYEYDFEKDSGSLEAATDVKTLERATTIQNRLLPPVTNEEHVKAVDNAVRRAPDCHNQKYCQNRGRADGNGVCFCTMCINNARNDYKSGCITSYYQFRSKKSVKEEVTEAFKDAAKKFEEKKPTYDVRGNKL